MQDINEIPLETLLCGLLLDPNTPQKITLTTHPDCYMVTVYNHEGRQVAGASCDSIQNYPDLIRETLGGLLTPEPTVADTEPPTSSPEAQTSPEATPPSEVPSAPSEPPHSASDPGDPLAEAFDLGAATPESPSQR